MKVKNESEVAQSCPTLRDPMDCSLPGSSIHGFFQARVLEWVAIAFSGQELGERLTQEKFGSKVRKLLKIIAYSLIGCLGLVVLNFIPLRHL